MKRFYDDWEDVTNFEQVRINAIEKLIKFLNAKFEDEIYSIMIYGSFPRREYRSNSDIDMIIFTHRHKDLNLIKPKLKHFLVEEKLKEYFKNGISVYSLEGMRNEDREGGMMSTRTRVLLSKEYILLYGKQLPYEKLPMKTYEEAFNGLVKYIKENIKNHTNEELAKLYLYTRYLEMKMHKRNINFSFQVLKDLSEKGMLLYECADYFLSDKEDLPNNFMYKLEKKLSSLEFN